ncbi:MAG: acyl carrier protein [Deltaproteobacteria bacterium]|nr:acyl carrier protein [Deltaproteobacteria bacterium]
MSRDEVKRQLADLVCEIAKVPLERITEEATVDDGLQMHSVAFVELQVAIEEAYDIQIDPIQVVELNQFGAIVDYVHRCALGENQ